MLQKALHQPHHILPHLLARRHALHHPRRWRLRHARHSWRAPGLLRLLLALLDARPAGLAATTHGQVLGVRKVARGRVAIVLEAVGPSVADERVAAAGK